MPTLLLTGKHAGLERNSREKMQKENQKIEENNPEKASTCTLEGTRKALV